MSEFTWNKEKKKFVSPNGQILTGPEVLDMLNNLLECFIVQTEALAHIEDVCISVKGAIFGVDVDDNSDTGQVVNEEAVGSEVQPSE